MSSLNNYFSSCIYPCSYYFYVFVGLGCVFEAEVNLLEVFSEVRYILFDLGGRFFVDYHAFDEVSYRLHVAFSHAESRNLLCA